MEFVSQFDNFHEQAIEVTGLSDFGSDDYVAPMKLILSEYDRHHRYSAMGEQLLVGGIIGLLSGRLHAQHGFNTYPHFAQAKIARPIIIIGMLRTGTTALLQLLSQISDNQALTFWLANSPMPRPPRDTWEANPWYQRTAQNLAMLKQMNPRLMEIHPLVADQPDECRLAFDHSFWSPGLAITALAPQYAEWCINADARYAYQYYRKVLGLISGGSNKRWVLKDPSHLWGLDALLEAFPDACIVFTHRDITESMTSMVSLTYELIKLSAPSLTPVQHGREQLAHWGRAIGKAEKVRKQRNPAQFFDIHIKQLTADPLASVESIYRYFNLPFSEQNRQSIAQHAASGKRSGGHGAHQPAAEDFGFSEQDVYTHIGEYYERFISVNNH